jgi:hypothetical protein
MDVLPNLPRIPRISIFTHIGNLFPPTHPTIQYQYQYQYITYHDHNLFPPQDPILQ